MIRNRLRKALLLTAFTVTVLVLIGCSGQSGLAPGAGTPDRAISDHPVVTVLPDTYVAGGQAASIVATERPGDGELLLDVTVSGAKVLKAIFFHLEFDPAKYSVGRLDSRHLLGSEDQLISILLSDPVHGNAEYGEMLVLPQEADAQGNAKGFSGDGVLCTLHLKLNGAGSKPALSGRGASEAPGSDGARATLSYDGGTQSLSWQHFSPGDYNQDGTVAVSDLTPIGIHFGADVPAGSDPDGRDSSSIEDVVDGSNDGKVNVSDLTAIGLNFQAKAASYNVYRGALADFPAGNAEANGAGAVKLATIPFSAATGNAGQQRIAFSHVLGLLQPLQFYWVRPNDAADGSGADGTASTTISSIGQNEPPKADWIGPSGEQSTIPFEANFITANCSDPDGSITLFEFDADSDGSFEQTFISNPIQILHTYVEAGLHTATLRVTDNEGASTETTWDVILTVPGNQPPSVQAEVSPTSGEVPLAVHIDLSGSSDPDGSIVLYQVDKDFDGIYEQSSPDNPQFDTVYDKGGSYYLICQLTDDDGSRYSSITQIDVTDPDNLAPVASLSADVSSGPAPLTVNFDASASFDTDGSIDHYEWDFFGDGTLDRQTDGPQTSFTYSGSGPYAAQVTVVDDDHTASVPDGFNVDPEGGWVTSPVAQNVYLSEQTKLVPVVDTGPEIKPFVIWIGLGDQLGDLRCSLGNSSGDSFASPSLIAENSFDFDALSVGGTAAVASDTNAGLYWIRAKDATGSDWNDPVAIIDGQFSPGSGGISLALVDGQPAVACNPVGSASLYSRASDGLGLAWGIPTLLELDQKTIYPRLIGGLQRPVILDQEFSSIDDVDYLLTYSGDDIAGSSWGLRNELTRYFNIGSFGGTAAGGRAQICYSYYNLIFTARAANDNATSWGAPELLTDCSDGNVPQGICMASINGVPALAYTLLGQQLWYCRATDASASAWETPQCVFGSDTVGGICLANINNQAGISFCNGDGGNIYYSYLP